MHKSDNDIAIIGMSCIFPGANNLDEFWSNIINKVDSFQIAPEERIDKVFYDPDSKDLDRINFLKGGFIDDQLEFDPLAFGLTASDIKATEPDQLLSLMLASSALKDANVLDRHASLKNAGIIIGKSGFEGNESKKSHEFILGAEALVRLLKVTTPSLNDEELFKIKKQYQSQRSDFGMFNPMGIMPNMTAALVANRLNLGGSAYTVDAACASSIVAIDNCIMELQSNRSDLMIAGGINVALNPSSWSIFNQLGTFSKSHMVRPFDKKADGVLPGEGGGFVVLKRLKEALKDNHRIYGIVKGSGVSNDGSSTSLMNPSSKGQIKAINSAWDYSGLERSQLGYLEAHGSATVLGDKTELETLQKTFGPYNDKLPRIAMGTIKSMIGHTMAAAGMAGFIKSTLAVYHSVLPPTLNCDEPVEELVSSKFAPLTEATDWNQTDLPIVAAINSFGFGGTNSHAIIQQFKAEDAQKKNLNISHESPKSDSILLLARTTKKELINALQSNDSQTGNGNFRLALFNPSDKRKELAVRIINKNKPWRGRQDLWYTNSPLLNTDHKLAFIFPGLDPIGLSNIKTGNFPALARHFNFDTASTFDQEIGDRFFHADLDESSRLLDASLKQLDVIPDIVTGHSVGEWTACTTVGMVDKKMAHVLDERIHAKGIKDLDAVFLAISCSISEVENLLGKQKEIYLANDNCTSQVVVCGKRKEIEKFQNILNQKDMLSNVLPFQTGYHTPFAERFVADTKYCTEHVASYKQPKIPIWSSITAKPYPVDIQELKKLHIDFITHPVRFRELTENLYQEGVRVFVQIGSGSISGFIGDTLKNKDISVISAAASKRDALDQLKRVLAAIFTEGREVNKAFLGIEEKKKNKDQTKPEKRSKIKLDLSFPFIDYQKVLKDVTIERKHTKENLFEKILPQSSNPLANLLYENSVAINNSQEELFQLLEGNEVVQSSPVLDLHDFEKTNFIKRIKISIQAYPELKDHIPFRRRSKANILDHEGDAVVPLTMFLDLFLDTINERYPSITIEKLIDVKAHQFMWIKQVEKEIEIVGTWHNDLTLHLEIEQYVSVKLVFKATIKNNVEANLNLIDSKSIPIAVHQSYDDGYLFHGETYQCIKKITGYKDNMIETNLVELEGKGSMLDSIGQSIGLQHHLADKNIRGFPVGINEIIFCEDPLDKSGTFKCTTQIIQEDDNFIYNDVELIREGKLWCKIKGWKVNKSELNDHIWRMMTHAEGQYVATLYEQKVLTLKHSLFHRANTWFTIQNIYLDSKEIDIYNSFSTFKKRDWLLGRIAAKDSIRMLIEKVNGKQHHPSSFAIINNEDGKPEVFHNNMISEKVFVSIAHKNGMAVAHSSLTKPIGVDIEEIKPRDNGFYDMVLNPAERTLFNQYENKEEWITRIWVAKESYGKSLGVGLAGTPLNYTINKIDGEQITIDKTTIQTKRYENHIIGWTI